MKSLFIYDNTGSIIIMMGGVETLPNGVNAIVSEVPERMKSAYVDVEHKRVIFETYEEGEE